MTDRFVETLTAALRQAAEARGWRPPDALADSVRRRAVVVRRRRTLAAGASTLVVVVCLVAVVWQGWGVRRAVDGPVGVPSTSPTAAVSVGPDRGSVRPSVARTQPASLGAGPAAADGAGQAGSAGSATAVALVAAAAPGAGPRLLPRIENDQGTSTLVVPSGRVRLPATTPGVADWHTTAVGWVVEVLPSADDGQGRVYAVSRNLSLRLLDSGHLGAMSTDPGGTRVAYVRQRSVPGQPESTDGVLVVADVSTGVVLATWPEPGGVGWIPTRWLPGGLVVVTVLDGSPQRPQVADLIDVGSGTPTPIAGWGPVVSVAALPAGSGYDTALVRVVGDRHCLELVRGLGRGDQVTCGPAGVLRPNPYGSMWSFETRADGVQGTQLVDVATGEQLPYHPPTGLPEVGLGSPTWEDATHAYACVGQQEATDAAGPVTLCPRFAVRWDVTSGRWERIAL